MNRFQPRCMKMRTAKTRRLRKRRGVAAVEFAVCLPVIILIVFGSIEASSFIFLKQSLSSAAYEGIREAVRSDSTTADATSRASNILDSRLVQGFQVSFPGGNVENAERGDEIVIEVSAPTQPNSPLAGNFIANRTLTARVVMVKE